MVVEYSSKSYPLWSYISGIKGVMRMVPSLRKFDSSEVAKKRMEMIRFYDAHGEAITKQAFGVDRKVISRWKQRLKNGEGSLSSLVPKSTRPHQTRQPATKNQNIFRPVLSGKKYSDHFCFHHRKRHQKKQVLLSKGQQNIPRPGQQMGSKSS